LGQLAYLDTCLAVFLELKGRAEQVTGFGPLQLGLLEGQRLAIIGCQTRLRIERVNMGRSAGHEEEDDSFGFGGYMGWRGDNGLRLEAPFETADANDSFARRLVNPSIPKPLRNIEAFPGGK